MHITINDNLKKLLAHTQDLVYLHLERDIFIWFYC